MVVKVWFRIASICFFLSLGFSSLPASSSTPTGQATARSYEEVFVSRWVYLLVLGKEEGEGPWRPHRHHKETNKKTTTENIFACPPSYSSSFFSSFLFFFFSFLLSCSVFMCIALLLLLYDLILSFCFGLAACTLPPQNGNKSPASHAFLAPFCLFVFRFTSLSVCVFFFLVGIPPYKSH